MKARICSTLFLLFALPAFVGTGQASTVFLDDTWADGTRTNQNLPSDSAWFASTGSALTATTNAMNLTLAGSALQVITYFGTNDTLPIPLNVGDTLLASFKFTFTNIAAP